MTIDSTTASNLAGDLFDALTAGRSFDLPAIDLNDDIFDIPDAPVPEIPSLTEADLTSRTAGGDGLFDGLMVSIGQHLQTEYTKNRITGKEYAQAWLGSMQTALGSAVQYLLSKDQAHYQALLVQRQARLAEIQVVSERVNLEIAKARLASARIEANTAEANYALMKLQLATQNAQFEQLLRQNTKLDYEITNLLPQELAKSQKQVEALTAETSKLAYEVSYLLPKELEKATKQIEAVTAEISATTAKKDQTLYETASILPTQKTVMETENALKTYQLTDHLPAQVAGIEADTLGKIYNNNFLLPAQLISINEQNEGHRAKTLDTRTDGTPVKGAIGVQKDLQKQQIDSFKRDAETKVAKMILDTWITQKSLDEGLKPPASLTDTNINTVMEKLRANLDL